MYDNIEKGQYDFPMMAQILPEMERGKASLTHRTITEEEVSFDKMRAAMHRDWTYRGLKAGTYVVLRVDGEIMMSDTWLERYTSKEAVDNAKGNVLIGGLGVGLILTRILDKPEVESVTVLEKSPDVIALIAPYFQHPKLTIIEADVFKWKPTQKYQTIFFDIWPDICTDNAEQIGKLHRKYSHAVDRTNGHYLGSWMQEEVRRLRRTGNWR